MAKLSKEYIASLVAEAERLGVTVRTDDVLDSVDVSELGEHELPYQLARAVKQLGKDSS